MTNEEIKAMLVAFAGQGNQIDLSGKLPAFLNELVSRAVPVEVTDITAIDGAILDALQCGDRVVKVTGVQKHLYTVSYKGEGEGEGLCLTYADASGIETVSYDRTESGWAYNSTDKGSF